MQFSMNPSALLLATFLLSVAGLFAFIWSLRKGLFEQQSSGARVIFAPEEIGRFDDPANNVARLTAHDAAQQAELNDRAQADRGTAVPAFVLFTFAVVWLLVASAAGLLASQAQAIDYNNPGDVQHAEQAQAFGVSHRR